MKYFLAAVLYILQSSAAFAGGVWEKHAIPKLPRGLIAEIPSMIITNEGKPRN
jgi:hypothetical protein